MNCRTAEEMVNRYISRTMSVKELEEFLEHISKCSSCYDELETYFIVREVTQQLNETGSEHVLDFKMLLEQDLKKSRRYVRTKKAAKIFETFVVCLGICLAAGVLIYVLAAMLLR